MARETDFGGGAPPLLHKGRDSWHDGGVQSFGGVVYPSMYFHPQGGILEDHGVETHVGVPAGEGVRPLQGMGWDGMGWGG